MTDPENCGHGGTIHLAGYPGDASKQCKLCGAVFDSRGEKIANSTEDLRRYPVEEN